MKRFGLVVALALLMGGCALFGVSKGPDGQPTNEGGGGIVGTLFSLAGLPWMGTVIAGLAGTYCEVKRRNWKAAATSTFKALEDVRVTPEGEKAWKVIKGKVVESHAAAKVTKFVDKALGNS